MAIGLNEKCVACGHAYKFHIDAFGIAQPCDFEIQSLTCACEDTPDGVNYQYHCECNQFVQEPMVDVNTKEHAGAVCGNCGKTVTEAEYSYGGSKCCDADVVAEEDYV